MSKVIEVRTIKVLELFCGKKCISNSFKSRGHTTYTADWNPDFNPDFSGDVESITSEFIINNFGYPDVIWASPDCTTYSIAAISHHREKNKDSLEPKSAYAKKCDITNKHVLKLIDELKPKYFFLENPRGGDAKNELC